MIRCFVLFDESVCWYRSHVLRDRMKRKGPVRTKYDQSLLVLMFQFGGEQNADTLSGKEFAQKVRKGERTTKFRHMSTCRLIFEHQQSIQTGFVPYYWNTLISICQHEIHSQQIYKSSINHIIFFEVINSRKWLFFLRFNLVMKSIQVSNIEKKLDS